MRKPKEKKYSVPPKLYTAYGKTQSLQNWSEDPLCVCSHRTLRARVYQLKWDVERAISEPIKRLSKEQKRRRRRKKVKKPHWKEVLVSAWGISMNLADWAKQRYVTVSLATLSRRISRDKWPPEKALMTPPHKRYAKVVLESLPCTKSPWDMTLGEYVRHCLQRDTPRGFKGR